MPSAETCSRPVAAYATPSGAGTAQAGGASPPGLRFPMVGQGSQPCAPVVGDDASAGSSSSAEVAGVVRSSAVWLAEVGPWSTGFPPQGVPPLDACGVPLTPLSTRSSLRERSLLPLKGAPPRADPHVQFSRLRFLACTRFRARQNRYQFWPCLLWPAGRLAHAHPVRHVRDACPCRAACFRRDLPPVVGFPHRRVRRSLRLPTRIWRAFPLPGLLRRPRT